MRPGEAPAHGVPARRTDASEDLGVPVQNIGRPGVPRRPRSLRRPGMWTVSHERDGGTARERVGRSTRGSGCAAAGNQRRGEGGQSTERPWSANEDGSASFRCEEFEDRGSKGLID